MADWRKYSDLRIGDTFPNSPARYVVTAEAIAAYDEISSSSLIAGSVKGGDAGRTASPMLAALYVRGAQNALKGPPGGIHAKQHFTFFKAVAAGDELSTILTVREKFERKGRNFIVCETETINQNGEKVSVGRITSIWGKET